MEPWLSERERRAGRKDLDAALDVWTGLGSTLKCVGVDPSALDAVSEAPWPLDVAERILPASSGPCRPRASMRRRTAIRPGTASSTRRR